VSNSNESRKASDVLLEIEGKVNALVGLMNTIELNQRIINNKLTDLLAEKGKEPPKFTVESINTLPPHLDPRNVPILAEDTLPQEDIPKGFRRTSRPETFAGDNARLTRPKSSEEMIKFPVQIPRGNKAEVIVPTQIGTPTSPPATQTENISQRPTKSGIPVMQRMVDGTGKSLFLADVSIIDNTSMETVFKTRTNGTGKWMASLPVGEYTVVMSKRNATTKEPVENRQTIQVDGTKSPLELLTCIIKN
jgi:hypothetical protein